MTAPAPSLLAAQPLRALVDIADEALDVMASEERLLCVAIERITEILGDRSTAWIHTGNTIDASAAASTHPDVVEARLESVVTAGAADQAVLVDADDELGGWLREHNLSQAIFMPILAQGRAIGTLAVTRAADRAGFDAGELAFAMAVADITGVSVQGARIRQATMISLEEVRSQVAIVEQVSEALVACDTDNLIINWNAGAEKLYGYSSSEAIGCHSFALLATRFFPTDGAEMTVEEVLDQVTTTGTWSGELRERAADGSPLVVLTSISAMTDSLGQPTGVVAVNRDVTGQRQEEHRAMHDALTGLPNRRLLDTRLYEAIARACRSDKTLAVLFIDLDGFKPINDTYGHAAGDEVLAATAERLLGAVRRSDTVGRLGGDEFLVILEEAGDIGHVEGTTARIAAAVAEPIVIGDLPVRVTASIGVAITRQPQSTGPTSEALLQRADAAMYEAKQHKAGPVFAMMEP